MSESSAKLSMRFRRVTVLVAKFPPGSTNSASLLDKLGAVKTSHIMAFVQIKYDGGKFLRTAREILLS